MIRKKQQQRPLLRDQAADQQTSRDGPETAQELQERLLQQIAEGGELCRQMETQFREHPSPESEVLIKLCQVLVLQLSAGAQDSPNRFQNVSTLMKPILAWARLQERRKLRELAERKHRDETAAQRAKGKRGPGGALTPETLGKIEHELSLF